MLPAPVPLTHTAAMKTPNTGRPWRVAGQRLSARQPSVFGVSWCSRKLAVSQTGKRIHESGCAACQHQMNNADQSREKKRFEEG